MKKNQFLLIIFINSIALAGIILTQIYWVNGYYHSREKEFFNSVDHVLEEVVEQIQENMLSTGEDLPSIDHRENNPNQPEVHNLDPEYVGIILKETLNSFRIDLEYKYAIIDSRNNSVIVSNVDDYQEKLFASRHHRLMTGFKDADFYYVSIYFPGELSTILRHKLPWLILSGFFTIILLLAYLYTFYLFYKQKRLSEMKSDFINNMTHEFKTPLATISLASEMLMKKAVQENPTRMLRYTRIIFDENSRLQNHVEQILRVSLLQKGKFKLRKKEVNIHDLINKIVESFEITVKDRGGDIKSHFCAKDFTVNADPAHLTNVITNLLDNAEKYSSEEPQIKIGTYNDGQGIIISVEDKGIGISSENQRHIFRNLYRVPTGNIYKRDKGFGIGLYYVKTIVEAHGGHINLKSELGKGSRFDIFLPFLTKSTSGDHEEFKET